MQWRDIAVIVRSTADIGQMRRTLLAAGVPVHISPTDVILAEQRLVSAMLLALRALEEDLSNAELEELLTGPVGGADPVTLRRLIRGLRRWAPDTAHGTRVFYPGARARGTRRGAAGYTSPSLCGRNPVGGMERH